MVHKNLTHLEYLLLCAHKFLQRPIQATTERGVMMTKVSGEKSWFIESVSERANINQVVECPHCRVRYTISVFIDHIFNNRQYECPECHVEVVLSSAPDEIHLSRSQTSVLAMITTMIGRSCQTRSLGENTPAIAGVF